MEWINRTNKRYGMVIDLDKCTGCGACMVACMAENNVAVREDETDKLLSVHWMRVYRLTNGKPFPQTEECFLPRPCQQCEGQPRPLALRLGLPGHRDRLRHAAPGS